MNTTENRYTLAILVNNHPGVLMRVVSRSEEHTSELQSRT